MPRLCLLIVLIALSPPLQARDRAGVFDYYVLALSWNPSWCAADPDRQGERACQEGRGWVLHGLWPQYAYGGWPEFCRTDRADPPRRATRAMADIMGSAGLAWHQWKKHGRCTGLRWEDYFAKARGAFEAFRPLARRDGAGSLIDPGGLDEQDGVAPEQVEDELFLANHQGVDPDAVIVTCRNGLIREIRVCLDKTLEPRRCAGDVLARQCRRPASMPPMR